MPRFAFNVQIAGEIEATSFESAHVDLLEIVRVLPDEVKLRDFDAEVRPQVRTTIMRDLNSGQYEIFAVTP